MKQYTFTMLVHDVIVFARLIWRFFLRNAVGAFFGGIITVKFNMLRWEWWMLMLIFAVLLAIRDNTPTKAVTLGKRLRL